MAMTGPWGPLAYVATIGAVLRPDARYARADDGVTIAYPVVGDGPVTVLFASPLISQLELAWEEPTPEHFWSRFAACARVVMFDRRGAGLSDPPAASRPSSGVQVRQRYPAHRRVENEFYQYHGRESFLRWLSGAGSFLSGAGV